MVATEAIISVRMGSETPLKGTIMVRRQYAAASKKGFCNYEMRVKTSRKVKLIAIGGYCRRTHFCSARIIWNNV